MRDLFSHRILLLVLQVAVYFQDCAFQFGNQLKGFDEMLE